MFHGFGSWQKVFFYFDLEFVGMTIKGLLLLWSGVVGMTIKGPLLLWFGVVGMTIKGLLLFWSGMEMSIKGPLLLWLGVEWWSKVLFYFDLDFLSAKSHNLELDFNW